MKTIFPDIHVHSRHSPDSRATMAEHCERALEIGLTHLAFTDHLELDSRNLFYECYDYDRARAEFQAAREKYGARLALYFGVEVTYQRSAAGTISEALNGREYDLVIGSVHFLEDFGADISSKERTPQAFSGNDPAEVYAGYLDEVLSSVQSGLFDVIGHIGIIYRHGAQFLAALDPARFEPQCRRLAEAIAASGVAVEVNESVGGPYPDGEFLRTLVEKGCRDFTVCSDAHEVRGAHGLGVNVGQALESLGRCGIDEITLFSNRKKSRCRFSQMKSPGSCTKQGQ